jgi:hypothetical protein
MIPEPRAGTTLTFVPLVPASPVRPTKRCLNDLGLAVPVLTEPLHMINHPLIRKAQNLPAELAASGAERIRSLNDRLWYKVKIGRERGAAILLSVAEVPEAATGWRWWLCAAGYREEGSRVDFYAALEEEAKREGGRRSPSSDHLLPTDWDWRRLVAELGEAWRAEVRQAVINVVAASLEDGNTHSAEFGHYTLSALVHPEEGDAYLSLRAKGFLDPKIIALILDSIPGVSNEFWQEEPSSVAGLSRERGELIWSTLLPESAIEEIRTAAREA